MTGIAWRSHRDQPVTAIECTIMFYHSAMGVSGIFRPCLSIGCNNKLRGRRLWISIHALPASQMQGGSMKRVTVFGRIQKHSGQAERAQTHNDAVLSGTHHIVLDAECQETWDQHQICIQHTSKNQLLKAFVKIVPQCLNLVANLAGVCRAAVYGHIVNIHTGQFESAA